MWLSQQFSKAQAQAPSSLGEVTIPGAQAAARSGEGEQRLLPLISPGGYAWLPETGAQVLVLREGSPCILGLTQPELPELEPGEVLLYAGTASIRLKKDGSICLNGRIFVNGSELGGESLGE